MHVSLRMLKIVATKSCVRYSVFTMRRLIVFAIAGTCCIALSGMGRSPSPVVHSAASPIELDAVVLDQNDQSVHGLQRDAFQIKEDGRRVELTGFREVSAAGISGRDDGRSVVLLLDDHAVPLATTVIQNIAKLFVSFARPLDSISVVRLTHREDEAAGGVPAALERIDEYRAGSPSFLGRDMRDDVLQTVARVARQLEPVEHRRKVLVCVGAREVCDPFLEVPESSLLWPSWRDAIATTARANASVYVVSPSGVLGRMDLGGGLVDTTGGGVFGRSNDFAREARMIWDQASHYYLLQYTPSSRRRDLHTIDVSIKRSGLRVQARHGRGD
jgi:VWFA-related protein